MGRGRGSNDKAIFEALSGLAGIFVLACMFVPGFKALILTVFLSVFVIAVISLLVWAAYRSMRTKAALSSFGTGKSYWHPDFRSREAPTNGGGILQAARASREQTISEGLKKIDWFQFEKLVELIYQHRGFAVTRLGGANPDGGVDLILKSKAEETIVQCKHWRKQMVGVRDIREFLGTLTDQKIAKGIFVTLAGYTEDARQLADKHGIQTYKETDILNMLEETGLTNCKEISELFSDETKICPKCENEMVLRTARGTTNKFWGCSTYPRCRCIINLED
jgi:hypothetical protein